MNDLNINVKKEKYHAIIVINVEQDNGIIYTEIWNFKNKILKNIANHIGKKYIEFFERKYDDAISNAKDIDIKISSLKINECEIKNDLLMDIDLNISANVGIKELNQKFNNCLTNIMVKDLAKELINTIELYAYECDTDMNAINVSIKRLNIKEN